MQLDSSTRWENRGHGTNPPVFRRCRRQAVSLIVHRGLHGALVDDLGKQIITGAIPAGGMIVPADIEITHAVSRTVVREALRVLEAKGLVAARQNVGTRCLSSDSWDMLDPDVIAWRLDGPDRAVAFGQLLELRSTIEPLAARLSAERADDASRRLMREYVGRMVRGAEDGNHLATLQADTDLHAEIFRTAGNAMLARLAFVASVALNARRAQVAELGFMPGTIEQHVELVESITAGDGARAAAVMAQLASASSPHD